MPINRLPPKTPKPPPLPTGDAKVGKSTPPPLPAEVDQGRKPPVVQHQRQQDTLGPASRATVEQSNPFGRSASLKGSPLGTRLSSGGNVQPAFGTPAFEKRLDLITGSKARPNNRLKLLFDGVHSFAQRKELIKDAKESIHLQTFIFTDDETGWEMAKLLAGKADEGLEVRVIYDALGSNRSKAEMFDFMRDHGVEVRPYGELSDLLSLNARWHEKSFVVDGKHGVMGGMNIADEYALGGSGRMLISQDRKSSEPWRDVDILIEGPAVADEQAGFLANWARLGQHVSAEQQAKLVPEQPEHAGGPSVRVIQHDPHTNGGDAHTKDLYLQCIRSAQSSITIENAYFIPSADIREALKEAAQRGVKVRIMSNSEESNDISAVSECARYFYRELLDAGCEIFEKHGGTLHAKTAAFDGEFAIVGSCNLNGRSDGRDTENVIATNDPATAEALIERFEGGVPQAQQIVLDEINHQGMLRTVKQFALSSLAWTF